MDTVARWIAEFLVRQSLNDCVFNRLMAILLPSLKDDRRLMKFLMLRRISSEVSSGLISENALDSLEVIEEIDHGEGVAALDSMKEAYCKVAMDCTVRCLRENPDDSRAFFDAIVRIWRGRIFLMETWGDVGFVTEDMRDLKDEIEAALWNTDVRKKILLKDTQNYALESVRDFLKEVMEVMGPSFLEQTASILNENEEGGDGQDRDGQNRDGQDRDGQDRDGKFSNGTSAAKQIEQGQGCLPDSHYKESNICIENVPNGNNAEMDVDAQENLDVCNEHVQNNNSISMDVDSHKDLLHMSSDKHNLPLTPEVTKVQNALKLSSTELHVAVEDPLPAALRIAATISSDIARNGTNQEHLGENQNEGANTCNPSDDDVHTKEIDTGNQTVVSRPSIMLRNNTARTHEWEECSVGSSLSGSPNRLHLRTPRNTETSLLIQHDIERGVAVRRKVKKWSSLEEQTLRDGVKEYGRGNWKLILDNYRHIFEERTVVDLKDKWRNLTK